MAYLVVQTTLEEGDYYLSESGRFVPNLNGAKHFESQDEADSVAQAWERYRHVNPHPPDLTITRTFVRGI